MGLTQAGLKARFRYAKTSGKFTRRVTCGRFPAGLEAGYANCAGYRVVMIDGRAYLAHRLAWLYVTGTWPKDQVDHRNGRRSDNRWCNLREATGAENSQNRTRFIGKYSKYAGVTWNARANRWVSQIHVDGKNRGLGYFAKEIDAHRAYIDAKRHFHPFSNNSNVRGKR